MKTNFKIGEIYDFESSIFMLTPRISTDKNSDIPFGAIILNSNLFTTGKYVNLNSYIYNCNLKKVE